MYKTAKTETTTNIVYTKTQSSTQPTDNSAMMELLKQNQEFKELLIEQQQENQELQKQLLEAVKEGNILQTTRKITSSI